MDGPSANTLSESHVVHLMNREPLIGHSRRGRVGERKVYGIEEKEKVKNYCLNCSSNVYHLWSVTNPSLLSYIHCRSLSLFTLLFSSLSILPLFISSSSSSSFILFVSFYSPRLSYCIGLITYCRHPIVASKFSLT